MMSKPTLLDAMLGTIKVYKSQKFKPKLQPKHFAQKQKVQICLKGVINGVVTLDKLKKEQDALNQQLKSYFKAP